MAAHLAPHLPGAGISVSYTWTHLLIMGFVLTLAQAAEYEGKKCNKSEDCDYKRGEHCQDNVCKCEPATCNKYMLTLPVKCTEDGDCVQLVSFSQCMQPNCICLPGYRPLPLGHACELISIPEATTTSSSWLRPETPYRGGGVGEADYSAVVKMALGAAIVMLAGVILALIWNLYRERSRARRALAGHGPATRRRRPNRTCQRPPRPNEGRAVNERLDNPPRYDDVFFITANEPVRRHEKPPSYEEALRDQQIPIVAPPAYLNFGFNDDLPAASRYNSQVPTTTLEVTPVVEPTPMVTTPANQQEAGASSQHSWIETTTLNVSSIINRLRPAARQSSDNRCTLRRTKSGRPPEDIRSAHETGAEQSTIQRSHSNPTPRTERSTIEPIAQINVDSECAIENSFPGSGGSSTVAQNSVSEVILNIGGNDTGTEVSSSDSVKKDLPRRSEASAC